MLVPHKQGAPTLLPFPSINSPLAASAGPSQRKPAAGQHLGSNACCLSSRLHSPKKATYGTFHYWPAGFVLSEALLENAPLITSHST